MADSNTPEVICLDSLDGACSMNCLFSMRQKPSSDAQECILDKYMHYAYDPMYA